MSTSLYLLLKHWFCFFKHILIPFLLAKPILFTLLYTIFSPNFILNFYFTCLVQNLNCLQKVVFKYTFVTKQIWRGNIFATRGQQSERLRSHPRAPWRSRSARSDLEPF